MPRGMKCHARSTEGRWVRRQSVFLIAIRERSPSKSAVRLGQSMYGALDLSSRLRQALVAQQELRRGRDISRSTATITSSRLTKSPTGLPTSTSLMPIIAVTPDNDLCLEVSWLGHAVKGL